MLEIGLKITLSYSLRFRKSNGTFYNVCVFSKPNGTFYQTQAICIKIKLQACICNSDRKQHAFCIILGWTFVSAANTERTVKSVTKSLIWSSLFKVHLPLKNISTSDFSTLSFNPGPFKSRLFNHELFNPGIFNHKFLRHRVE